MQNVFEGSVLTFPDYDVESVRDSVSGLRRSLADQGVQPGLRVAVCVENTPLHAMLILGCLEHGVAIHLYNRKSPTRELAAKFHHLDIAFQISLSGTRLSVINEEKNCAQNYKPEIILETSGSTGTAKFVNRSMDSLLNEAQRYIQAFALSDTTKILLPLPINHAYALGWLFAAAVAGSYAIVVEPTSLNTIDDNIFHVDFVALTPNIARLLSLRKTAPLNGTKRPVVMVGAGPVDTNIESLFNTKYGIGLSRNYGSTETGAIFAGLAPLPPYCVGNALPNIEFRITRSGTTVSGTGSNNSGYIEVKTEDGQWYRMSDICYRDAENKLTIVGRNSNSIRRGDCWISPYEIESAIKAHPNVIDAYVLAQQGTNHGDDRIIANVWLLTPYEGAESELRNYLKERLEPIKVPGTINVKRAITRDANGKIAGEKHYRFNTSRILARSRDYKVSNTLFALNELGVFNNLASPFSSEQLAKKIKDSISETNLCEPSNSPLTSVELLISFMESQGFIETSGEKTQPVLDFDALLSLEQTLSQTYCTDAAIKSVFCSQNNAKPIDRIPPSDTFVSLYNHAMHGDYKRLRMYQLFRHLKLRDARKTLEICVGSGSYSNHIAQRYKPIDCHCITLGELSPRVQNGENIRYLPEDSLGIGEYDLCIIDNAIHCLDNPISLETAIKTVKPGGEILIDDIFLPRQADGSEIIIDWLTHGGVNYSYIEELEAALRLLGHPYKVFDLPSSHLHFQILLTINEEIFHERHSNAVA